jgi:hypothetical protein
LFSWTGYDISSDGKRMAKFFKNEKRLKRGQGHDSNLINGLMFGIIDDDDLLCTATGKGATEKLSANKIRLLNGKLTKKKLFFLDTT